MKVEINWVSVDVERPEEDVIIWAYFPEFNEIKQILTGGFMNYEEDEGGWRGMGSEGAEFTYWCPIWKPNEGPDGKPPADEDED